MVLDKETEKAVFASGFYTVVKRFSSKEEKRRIVAHTVAPSDFAFSALSFENHLNVFHDRRGSLDEYLARGLTVFLNSTAVNTHFRRFNGHTQVNATDLRTLRYPDRNTLMSLGRWASKQEFASQEDIDSEVLKIA